MYGVSSLQCCLIAVYLLLQIDLCCNLVVTSHPIRSQLYFLSGSHSKDDGILDVDIFEV